MTNMTQKFLVYINDKIPYNFESISGGTSSYTKSNLLQMFMADIIMYVGILFVVALFAVKYNKVSTFELFITIKKATL
jgi:hypothetical protein